MDNKKSKIFGLDLALFFYLLLIVLPVVGSNFIMFYVVRSEIQELKNQVTVWQTQAYQTIDSTPSATINLNPTPLPSPVKSVKPASVSGEVK